MTIYDLNGDALYEAPITKNAIIKCELMGDYYISLPFNSSKYIDFKPGCYVLYKGRKFDIIDPLQPEKNQQAGGYKYELKFQAQQNHMKRRRVFWLHGAQNEATFHLTTTLNEFGRLIVDNMNAFFGSNNWVFGSIPIELTEVSNVVSFSGDTCWDAIAAIAETFNVEWWTEEVGQKVYLSFGKREFGSPEEFKQGDAISDIPIKRGDDANYGTRFYVFGSTRNLDKSYGQTEEGGIANHVSETRLHLPEGIEYIDSKEGLSQPEIVEQVVFFEDVYPKNTDTVTSIETVDRLIDEEDDTQVETIKTEAVCLYDSFALMDDARIETATGSTKPIEESRIFVGHQFTTASLANFYDGHTDMLPIGECELYKGNGRFQLYIEVWDNHNNVRYSQKVLDVNNDFSNNAPIYQIPWADFDWSEDVKPRNEYLRIAFRMFFEGDLERYDQPEDFGEIRLYETTHFVVFDNATYGPRTFAAYQVVSNETPFLPSDVIAGDEFKIKFMSGSLSGFEFDVDLRDDEDKRIDPSEWKEEDGFNKKFEIIAQIEDAGNDIIIIPNENMAPKVGDTFVLTGVKLSEERIKEAEYELLDVGTSWAVKNSKDTNIYDCPTNAIYCAKYDKNFEIGQRVSLIDQRLEGGVRESRIQGYEKSLWREYIATYTIGDNASYSRLGSIEKNIKENAYVVRSGVQSAGTIHIISSKEITAPSDDNVFSAVASDLRYLKNSEKDEFLKKTGGKINGSLEIEKPGTQLFLTADKDTDGKYIARIKAGSVGEDYGEISWNHGETHIKGESDTLQFNNKELITRDALEEAIENIDIGDLDLSDTPIAEDVLVADIDSVLTTSDFADTPIAEEVVPTEVADTLTYGEMQRSLHVFELEGLICLASSHPIFDDEVIALARKLSQGWSGKQGWSISQQFNSSAFKPQNPTHSSHMFTLIPWMMPNPKQPNGLYYYKVAIDGEWLSPSTLLSYFISSLDGHLKIYWGKRAKRVAFGADTSGKYKRAATLRFGVAVGHQIAPFKLCVQSKCFIYPDGHVLLNDTTWGQCVQFRV